MSAHFVQENIGPSIMLESWAFPYVECMQRSFLATWLAIIPCTIV